MEDLSALSPEELEKVTSALFKVGAWMSHAEDEDGEDDDQCEIAALSAAVKGVALAYEGPGMVDDIARNVLAHQDCWQEWADYSFNALDDVRTSLKIIKLKGTEADIKAYKTALVQVAETVAEAYGEFGDHGQVDGGKLSAFLSKIKTRINGDTPQGHAMNVSAVEEEYLNQLKTLLEDF
ncbi:MAG: hypothetical protein KTR28_07940 [Micavibrio sp.]|nr:hypothetical protein [Micavibrio sp.]